MGKVLAMKEEKALAVVENPTRDLVFYNAARTALEKAASTDEVKNIRNKAEAMRAYAAQANNKQLEIWASEIRARAERRAGQMLIEMAERGERRRKGENRPETLTPSLHDLGIERHQSRKWEIIARIPEEKFERVIAKAAETGAGVTTNALIQLATPPPKSERRLKRERWEAERRKQEDLDDKATMEDEVLPENYRSAFFLRTDTARRCAVYSGPIDREVIESARNVAKAWTKLADKLEEQL